MTVGRKRIKDVVLDHDEATHLTLPPLVIIEGLEPFVPGSGPIRVRKLGSGHSNETFEVTRNGKAWALRRPPRPPIPPTAHDVIREFRILSALAGERVRAPEPLVACEDVGPIGAPFYLMELIPGWVMRDRMPGRFQNPKSCWSAVEQFVDELVEVHAVDWRARDLAKIGRPSGYLERQLRRWRGQWEHNRTREIPEIETVGEWLAAGLPSSQETTLVHGDYKLDNAIFSSEPPLRLLSIVDWEMATLGDPLADVGLMCATYVEPGERADPILGFTSATSMPGSPYRVDIASRYEERSGRSLDQLAWYEALALWKILILLEGSYKRFLAGTTTDSYFASLELGIPRAAKILRERALSE